MEGDDQMRNSDYYASKGISHREDVCVNSRGMNLLTATWMPGGEAPRAIILLLHGYGFDCTTYFADTAERLAAEGYGVFGIDYEGHGRSDGLAVFIPDFETIVDDCMAFGHTIRARPQFSPLPMFLLGESMGGAVAIHLHRRDAEAWRGAILMAPMCKISEKVKPPALLVALMSNLAYLLPAWQIVPAADIVTSAVRDPIKLKKISSSRYTYRSRPRLRTALTMLETSRDVEKRLHEVSLPFLLLHGDSDIVTELSGSQSLYDRACSADKTFIVYPGAWHLLTEGEPEETTQVVFKDMLSWLAARCKPQL